MTFSNLSIEIDDFPVSRDGFIEASPMGQHRAETEPVPRVFRPHHGQPPEDLYFLFNVAVVAQHVAQIVAQLGP